MSNAIASSEARNLGADAIVPDVRGGPNGAKVR
jgi:hypothetical protein